MTLKSTELLPREMRHNYKFSWRKRAGKSPGIGLNPGSTGHKTGNRSIALSTEGTGREHKGFERQVGKPWRLHHFWVNLVWIVVRNLYIRPHVKNKEVRVNPKASYGLWVMMCQCRPADRNQCPTLVREVDGGKGCAYTRAGGVWELFALAARFGYERNTALKSPFPAVSFPCLSSLNNPHVSHTRMVTFTILGKM